MASENDTVMLVPNKGWDERILVCRCGDLVDTFIVVSSRYVVLVDTMINFFTAEALLAIARPMLASRELLVVNSHADWDHAWGNHVFATPGGLVSRTDDRTAQLCSTAEIPGDVSQVEEHAELSSPADLMMCV